ncbi:MAG: UbiA family prenyltransferase [Candidatus Hodarchaeales archaeon]
MGSSSILQPLKQFYYNWVNSFKKWLLLIPTILFFFEHFELSKSLPTFQLPHISLEDYIYLIRPYGSISNFVSIGFGLLLTNMWQSPSIIIKYFWTGIAIGPLLWGGLYTFNSVFDADFDRIHPTKKSRPLAAQRVTKNLGLTIALIHTLLGLSLIAILSPVGLFLALIMVGFQILYCFPCFRLKETYVNLFFSGPMNHFFRILIGWVIVLPLVNAPYLFLIGVVCILAIGYLSYKIQDKEVADHFGYRGLESHLLPRGVIIFDSILVIIASFAIILAFLTHQITWHLLLFIPLSIFLFLYLSLSSSPVWQAAKPGFFIGKIHALVIIFFMIELLLFIIGILPDIL